jgi:hypothetical protein
MVAAAQGIRQLLRRGLQFRLRQRRQNLWIGLALR